MAFAVRCTPSQDKELKNAAQDKQLKVGSRTKAKQCPIYAKHASRRSSSSILCSSLSDPYASEASSPFPNNEFLNFVQFLNFPVLRNPIIQLFNFVQFLKFPCLSFPKNPFFGVVHRVRGGHRDRGMVGIVQVFGDCGLPSASGGLPLHGRCSGLHRLVLVGSWAASAGARGIACWAGLGIGMVGLVAMVVGSASVLGLKTGLRMPKTAK